MIHILETGLKVLINFILMLYILPGEEDFTTVIAQLEV